MSGGTGITGHVVMIWARFAYAVLARFDLLYEISCWTPIERSSGCSQLQSCLAGLCLNKVLATRRSGDVLLDYKCNKLWLLVALAMSCWTPIE